MITYNRECALIAGAILALAAEGDQKKESVLVESYLRITDRIFEAREGRGSRQRCAKWFYKSFLAITVITLIYRQISTVGKIAKLCYKIAKAAGWHQRLSVLGLRTSGNWEHAFSTKMASACQGWIH
jgi:hypothetical protein